MVLYLCYFVLAMLVFFFGAAVFSFLNVVVYRVPRHRSFVTGRSFCPSCGHSLGAPDLVPVFSYIFLRGRCRHCGAPIGIRDTLVEAVGGGLALFCVMKFDNISVALTVFAFYGVLAVVTLLDIDTMEIEDGCSVAIVVLAVISCFTMPEVTVVQRLIGMVCISLPMLLLTLAIPGAFGGGDIKLMAAAGLFLGWRLNLVAMLLAVLTGGIWGIFLLLSGRKGRKEHFAFGPFLCLGMLLAVSWGEWLLNWYTGFLLG